jgi:CRISPR-associated protein Cas2
MTLIVVSYDVSTKTPEGKRRLRRVARACEDYGQRVQCSVFECWVDPTHITVLKNRLLGLIEPTADSLRFYYLGEHWRGRTEHFGSKIVHDPQGSLIL